MNKRSILHIFDPTPNNSPFDINMALDNGFDVLMPYSNVKLDSIHRLTQDVIFSRSPKGIKRTGIYIGGKDIGLAMDMIVAAKQAMFAPFEVSILADPSGAFTTAAATVACVEYALLTQHNKALKDCKSVVFGGTGAVGIATGVIASLAGSQTQLVDHISQDTAADAAKQYNRRYQSKLSGVVASSDADKIALLDGIDVVFCCAQAGVQVLSDEVVATATGLKVAGDVNAVPPAGIAGIASHDFCKPLANSACGVGALAIGDIKYRVQQRLLDLILSHETPICMDFRQAFTQARQQVQSKMAKTLDR